MRRELEDVLGRATDCRRALRAEVPGTASGGAEIKVVIRASDAMSPASSPTVSVVPLAVLGGAGDCVHEEHESTRDGCRVRELEAAVVQRARLSGSGLSGIRSVPMGMLTQRLVRENCASSFAGEPEEIPHEEATAPHRVQSLARLRVSGNRARVNQNQA
jgi:hypothetical protein